LPKILKGVRNVKYIIVGDGPYKDDLKLLVNKMKLKRHVKFVGEMPMGKLNRLYEKCNVFVLTSILEAFGVVYVEAGYFSKPLIGSRGTGAEEIIKNGVNGFLVDPYNTNEIASVITKLLKNSKLARRMGKKSHEIVLKHFDSNKISEKNLRIYRSLQK
jgi:glycosyltransferase involved in cell wall biosynthesis